MRNERAIFLAALEKDTSAERSAYVAEACGDDAALRQRVEALLASHEQAGSFLEKPVPERLAEECTARPASEQMRDESAVGDGDARLDFLTPSDQPGSLGRLDHYEVLEVVGRGGTGVVLRARDTKLSRVVALKVLAAPLAVSATARQRFAREARAAAAVRDDHVVAVYAVRDNAPVPYLVMEYIDGCNLEALLRKGGPLEVKEILRIGMQIASGLAAAHQQGLIHRDVKPANILLENGVQRVKLSDFGLARAADDASLTQTGFIAGTPLYMAPEQAAGEPIDARSDLFSLGSVLYELCTGRTAFRAVTTVAVIKRVSEDTPRPIREVNPDIPESLCRLIEGLHAKKPAERPASALEVADALAELLAELAEPRTQRSGGSGRRHSATPPLRHSATYSAVLRVRLGQLRWFWAAAALVVLFASLGLSEATGVTDVRGTVIRLFSPEGTLVVEVDDPGVDVTVDGSDLVITGAGAKEIRLKPGQYKVEASKDGKLVSQELVTVTRNGRQVVRISKEAQPVGHVSNVPDPEARWKRAPQDAWHKSAADLPTLILKKSLLGHTHSIVSVAYSPAGRLLASGDEAGQVRVWNVPDGTLRYVLPAMDWQAFALAFSPDGRFLLTANWHGDIQVWDAETGKHDGVLKGHTKALYEFSFGPDGKTLVSGGWDAVIRVWDFATRREVKAIPSPGGEWIRSVAVSARGMIAVGGGPISGEEGKVFLLDRDGQVVKTLDAWAGLLCFSSDGQRLARATWREGRATVWDVNNWEIIGSWHAHESEANSVAFSRDGRILATAGNDGAVRLWDIATQRPLAEVRHQAKAGHLALSPDGATLATTWSEARLIQLWDVSFLRSLKAPKKNK